jgi:hypothetical protein
MFQFSFDVNHHEGVRGHFNNNVNVAVLRRFVPRCGAENTEAKNSVLRHQLFFMVRQCMEYLMPFHPEDSFFVLWIDSIDLHADNVLELANGAELGWWLLLNSLGVDIAEAPGSDHVAQGAIQRYVSRCVAPP